MKGMHYNPILFRWEGNENALAPFDVPLPPPTLTSSPKSPPSLQKAAPALITNISATQGVQVVGGMVFDPQRMCWLKMAPHSTHGTKGGNNNNTPMSPDTIEDEDDPFAGLDDLEDSKSNKPSSRAGGDGAEGEEKRGGGGGLADEWLVGEEFDVGPEFVRRQRTEEEKWRRKVEAWVGEGRERIEREREGMPGREEWRWGIRVLAGEGR